MKGTITIVRQKCTTLILKLHPAEGSHLPFGPLIKPEGDIDRIVDELGNDLIRHVTEGIEGIRDEVKKARPHEDDPNYQLKIQVYKDLLEHVTNLIKQLTNFFDESLTKYRLRIEQLWNDIQPTSDWQQINVYIEEFEKDAEKLFGDAFQKYLHLPLSTIESKLNDMEQ